MPLDTKRPRAKPLQRGGARNRKHRTSLHLTKADCHKVLDACDRAYDARAPFTRFITLAWQLGGIDPKDCLHLTGEFLALAREWLRERGHAMPWAYVQECGDRYGAHAHALLHVPPSLDPLFRPYPRRWARKLLGGVYVAGVVDCQSLLYRTAAYSNPAAYWQEVRGKLHYMLKTAPAVLESDLQMSGWGVANWGQSCLVHGKRAGVWQRKRT